MPQTESKARPCLICNPEETSKIRERLKQKVLDTIFYIVPMDGKFYKLTLKEAVLITKELDISLDELTKIGASDGTD